MKAQLPFAPERGSQRDHISVFSIFCSKGSVMWEESALRGTLTQDPGVFDIPPSPDNTAGLSFSEDGRIL